MGEAVNMRQFLSDSVRGHLTIYIKPLQSIQNASVSIGKVLATAIIKTKPERRSKEMKKILESTLSVLPDNITVKDIDVLFNPVYELDILRLLETVYREKPYSIIWSGEYKDGKLTYSEYGYADYKEYAISNYDILCVY